MLHCAMQTSLENSARSSSHLGTAAVKLGDHSQHSDQNTHLSSRVSCHRNMERKPNHGKDPQPGLCQAGNSTMPEKEAAAANHLLPTSLKIETLALMMLIISAQLVCIPRKGHFSGFTGYWNTGRVQGNINHIRMRFVEVMLNLSPSPPSWHSNNLSEIQTWRTLQKWFGLDQGTLLFKADIFVLFFIFSYM